MREEQAYIWQGPGFEALRDNPSFGRVALKTSHLNIEGLLWKLGTQLSFVYVAVAYMTGFILRPSVVDEASCKSNSFQSYSSDYLFLKAYYRDKVSSIQLVMWSKNGSRDDLLK